MPNDDFSKYALTIGAILVLGAFILEEYTTSPKVIGGFSTNGLILLGIGIVIIVGAIAKAMQRS